MPSSTPSQTSENRTATTGSTMPIAASRIAAVTVFRAGALVERVADLVRSGSEGATYPESIRLPGLPLSLDDGSVRVRVEAAAEAGAAKPAATSPALPLRVTDARVALEVPEPDSDLAPPRDEELLAARRAKRRLEESIASAEGMMGRLETLASPARPRGAHGSPPPPSPTAARLALLDFRQAELERLGTQLVDLRQQLTAAGEHLLDLEDRQRRASTARQAREDELRKSLFVSLRPEAGADASAADAPCRLVVSYLVPGARWTPGYTVRFDPGFERVELALRAQVCQATGEDWNGVQLTLSTAKPQRWSELPELKALRIGRRQPPAPSTGWREPPAGTAELFDDYDRARQPHPKAPVPPKRRSRAKARPVPVAAAPETPETDRSRTEVASFMKLGVGADEPDAAAPEILHSPPRSAPNAVRASAPPPKAMAAREAGPKKARPRRAKVPKAPAEPELSAEITAPDDLLDYGRLRLAGADEPQRGKLRPAAGDEAYLEFLTSIQIEVRFNVLMAVQRAATRAKRAGRKPAPPGYSYPRAWRGFDHAYAGSSPVDVAADGVFHNLPLLSRQATAALRHVAVPREVPQAFRVATFDNPLKAPLPPGPADVYVGDDFLLTSKLASTAPGGNVELGLGVDEAIKLARNTRFREETSGLMRGRLELVHEVDVEVANRRATSAQVEVRERIPLPREGDDTIEVKVVDVKPAWQPFPQPRSPVAGGYRWALTLEAGESRTLHLRYEIHIPAKDELVGGNRRET